MTTTVEAVLEDLWGSGYIHTDSTAEEARDTSDLLEALTDEDLAMFLSEIGYERCGFCASADGDCGCDDER